MIAAPLMVWSPEQDAFYYEMATGHDNIILEAFAGVGKTTTIIEGGKRAPEKAQCYCAFAKKNERDLAEKLRDHHRAESKTLHGLGYTITQRWWERIGMERKKGDRVKALVEAVCGSDDRTPITIKKLVARLTNYGRAMAPHARALGDLTAVAIEYDCTPDEQWENDGFGLSFVEDQALKCMELAATKRPTTGIDYDDMLFLPVRNKWTRPMYDLVFVDERQDMTFTQLEIAMGVGRGRIVLVGDVRQAIYAFRGADTNAAIRLKETLNAKVMTLSTTYRCPKLVVAEAQKLVPEYRAATEAPQGVVDTLPSIDALVKAAQEHDFILSRTNAPLASVAMALIREKKRVRVQGKDIGAGLIGLVEKLASGRASDSLPEFLRKLANWEEREVTRAQAAGKDELVDGIHDKAETLRVVSEGAKGMPNLRDRLDYLFDDKRNHGTIVLSSVHKAKGLEAKRVFVLRDTLYPKLPQRVADKMTPEQHAKRAQEEQNIHYVAVTRAMETLTYVHGKPGAA